MPPTDLVADLRLLLPLATGQRAGVWGNWQSLAGALEAEGLQVIPLPSPAVQAGLDHLFIPELPPLPLDEILTQAAQALKTGGWLLAGMENPASLQRFGGEVKGRLTLRQFLGRLRRRGFQISRYYGAYDRLQHPQFLVPLDDLALATYFFAHIFIPYSRLSARAQPLMVGMAALGFQRLLFPAIVIVARRWAAEGA